MKIPSSHADAARLYGPEFAVDPANIYLNMRAKYGTVAPVLLEGDVPAWLVLSYRDVHHVLGNHQLFGRDPRRWNLWDEIPEDWPLRPFLAWSPALLHTEGTEHQRRASAIGDALDAVDRTSLARICDKTADDLIDTFIGDGKADLLTQFAMAYPIRVLAQLYGFSQEQLPGLAQDLMLASSQTAESNEAFGRVIALLHQLVAAQRTNPGTGVAARMAAHPAALSDDELAFDLFIMWMAGHQPTALWIANALRLMLVNDQFSLSLQGGRVSADHALNEVLWEDTPGQNQGGRWATQNCKLGDREINRGDLVVPSLQAANSDPLVQPPSETAIGTNRAHMSFAYGEHSCPHPAPEFAMLMAKTAIEVLLDRIPDIALAIVPEALAWQESVWFRCLTALPVTFTPLAPSVSH